MLKLPHFFLAGALCATLSIPSPTLAPAQAQSRVVAPIRLPGVRREAGAWLFNDSLFVAPGANRVAVGGPVFLPDLRRDKKNKLPLFRPAQTGAALGFATLPLPSLRQMSASGFDFAALQSTLAAQVGAARAAGQLYVGWALPLQAAAETGASMISSPPKGGMVPLGKVALLRSMAPLERDATTLVLKRLRAVLDAFAPESALLLQVEAERDPALAALDISAAAAACDAVILRIGAQNEELGAQNSLWPLKMARRVAEEQPDFDLPIFVALTESDASSNTPSADPAAKIALDSRLLEFFMGGATGFVVKNEQVPAWASAIGRNPGLFTGAVTLEDVAVLPSLSPRALEIVDQLRAVGRVPLAGRSGAEKSGADFQGESLIAVLDDQTTLETLSGLDKAIRGGNVIYLEGLPDLRNKTLLAKISDMTGTTLEVLPVPKSEILTLSDPWLFGDARGREISVSQRVKWTIKTSLAAQARKKKGEDVLVAQSVAKLAGDDNGLLIAPLGKGRIVWLAHPPVDSAGDNAARRDFYAAIAGSLQSALAKVSFGSGENEVRSGGAIHFALRASKTGTPIVAVFNRAALDAEITLSARGDAPIALDLGTEREIAAKVVGYSSQVPLRVPARGYAWLTFGATRALLDKERLTPRPKARAK